MTDDVMVRCHHPLNEHDPEQTLGDGEGQGSLSCYSPWGHKESDTTEQLNNHNKVLLSRWASFVLQVLIGQLRKLNMHTLKWQER